MAMMQTNLIGRRVVYERITYGWGPDDLPVIEKREMFKGEIVGLGFVGGECLVVMLYPDGRLQQCSIRDVTVEGVPGEPYR